MNQVLNFKIVYDNNLIIAIIAINMTVIGLTSLAQTKSIIGIDYGKFLINKYKVFNFIKIYNLLILFAIINVGSVFSLFIGNNKFISIVFVVLVLSLIFGIYYFFAYIMIENKFVKNQIYMQELLGLYYNSSKETSFEVDKLIKISNGSSTNKKISSDVINYLNNFNGDSQSAFGELFGPNSIIYKSTKKLDKKRRKVKDANPYVYRCGNGGVLDISHEFFQFFRYTELQDKWSIDILKITNRDDLEGEIYDKIRLYNFTRVITHINIFGNCEAIYKYKFLEHLIEFYYSAIKNSKDYLNKIGGKEKEHISEVEKYALEQIVLYIIKTIQVHKDINFINSSKQVLNKIVFDSEYSGVVELKDRFKLLLDNTIKCDDDKIKELFTKMLYKYNDNQNEPEFIKISEVKNYIKNHNKGINAVKKLQVEELFELVASP